MSKRSTDPVGVPSWVETYQPDPAAAAGFYAAVMGWEIDGARVARLRGAAGGDAGRAVAGIAPAPLGAERAVWAMHVRVASVPETLERVVAGGGTVLATPDADGAGVAVVGDPAGVVFCVRADGAGVEARGEPGAWAMSALHTTAAPDAAAAFYGAVLGWELATVPGTPLHAFWLPGATGVAGPPLPPQTVALLAPPAPDVPPHWAISFRVADVDITCARAGELGGTTLLPPTTADGLRTAVVADPQGGVLALVAGA